MPVCCRRRTIPLWRQSDHLAPDPCGVGPGRLGIAVGGGFLQRDIRQQIALARVAHHAVLERSLAGENKRRPVRRGEIAHRGETIEILRQRIIEARRPQDAFVPRQFADHLLPLFEELLVHVLPAHLILHLLGLAVLAPVPLEARRLAHLDHKLLEPRRSPWLRQIRQLVFVVSVIRRWHDHVIEARVENDDVRLEPLHRRHDGHDHLQHSIAVETPRRCFHAETFGLQSHVKPAPPCILRALQHAQRRQTADTENAHRTRRLVAARPIQIAHLVVAKNDAHVLLESGDVIAEVQRAERLDGEAHEEPADDFKEHEQNDRREQEVAKEFRRHGRKG